MSLVGIRTLSPLTGPHSLVNLASVRRVSSSGEHGRWRCSGNECRSRTFLFLTDLHLALVNLHDDGIDDIGKKFADD